jgi:hypothetical protein
MRGFGTSQVDFAAHRQFHLVDRVNLQIRSEFFNVNRPTFDSIRRSGGMNTPYPNRRSARDSSGAPHKSSGE